MSDHRLENLSGRRVYALSELSVADMKVEIRRLSKQIALIFEQVLHTMFVDGKLHAVWNC